MMMLLLLRFYILLLLSSLDVGVSSTSFAEGNAQDQLQVSSTKHEVMIEAPIDLKILSADVDLQKESKVLRDQKNLHSFGEHYGLFVNAGSLEADRKNARSDDDKGSQHDPKEKAVQHPYLTGFKRQNLSPKRHLNFEPQNGYGDIVKKRNSLAGPNTFQTLFRERSSRPRRARPLRLTPADNITLDDVPDNGRGVNTNGYHRVISQVSEVLNGLGPPQASAGGTAESTKKEDNYDRAPWQPLQLHTDATASMRPKKHLFRTKLYSTPPTPRPHPQQQQKTAAIIGGHFPADDEDEDDPQKGLHTSPTEAHHNAVGFFDEYLIEFDDEEGKKARRSKPSSGRSQRKKPASERARNIHSFSNYDTNDDYVDYDDPATQDDAGNHVQQQKEFSARPAYPASQYGQNFGSNQQQERLNSQEPEEVTGTGSADPQEDAHQGDDEEEGDDDDYANQPIRPNPRPNYETYKGNRPSQVYRSNNPSSPTPQLTGPSQASADEDEGEDSGGQHQEASEGHDEEQEQQNLAPYEEDNENIEQGVMKELGKLYQDKSVESDSPQDENVEQESDQPEIAPNSEYTELYGDKPTPLYKPNEEQQILQQNAAGPEDSVHNQGGEHEQDSENEPLVQDDEDHSPQHNERQLGIQHNHNQHRPQPNHDEGDEEHSNQPETEGVAYKDDNQWDDYFDGHKKGIESDIHNLAKNSESYNAPEGSQQDDGQQEEQSQQDEEGVPSGGSEVQEGSADQEDPEEEQRGRASPKSSSGEKKDPRERRVAGSYLPKNDFDSFREMQTQVEGERSKKRSDTGVEVVIPPSPSPKDLFTETTAESNRIIGDSSPKSFSTADIPGFDDFFGKLQKSVEKEITHNPPFHSGGAAIKWSVPTYDGEDKDKPADGVVDNSEDLLPTKYGDDDQTSPEELAWQMPSHEELQENYKTVVTSDSNVDPVTLPWSPSKIVTTPNAPTLAQKGE